MKHVVDYQHRPGLIEVNEPHCFDERLTPETKFATSVNFPLSTTTKCSLRVHKHLGYHKIP